MEIIKITTEYIKLDQLLKLADMAENGGHAKYVIQNGEVTLNGVTETQRGKKIRHGDKVSFGGKTVTVQVSSDTDKL